MSSVDCLSTNGGRDRTEEREGILTGSARSVDIQKCVRVEQGQAKVADRSAPAQKLRDHALLGGVRLAAKRQPRSRFGLSSSEDAVPGRSVRKLSGRQVGQPAVQKRERLRGDRRDRAARAARVRIGPVENFEEGVAQLRLTNT